MTSLPGVFVLLAQTVGASSALQADYAIRRSGGLFWWVGNGPRFVGPFCLSGLLARFVGPSLQHRTDRRSPGRAASLFRVALPVVALFVVQVMARWHAPHTLRLNGITGMSAMRVRAHALLAMA